MQKITRKGYNNCLNEMNILKTQISDVIKRIGHAKKHGDLSENEELTAELRAKRLLDKKMLLLIDITTNWDVIDLVDILNIKIIQIGATVTISIDNKKQVYQIVGEYESDVLMLKISYKTPFAQILIGKKKSDKFIYKEQKCIIKDIHYNDIN